MYFLIYSAHPKPGTKAFDKYAGAHIACWVNVSENLTARTKARQLIEAQDWTVDRLEEEYVVTREMAETSQGLQYFEQALIDGEVLVIFTNPVKPV